VTVKFIFVNTEFKAAISCII